MVYIYLALFWVIDTISRIDKQEQEILSRIGNSSCSLPYGVQEKIEQTYEIVSSATCEITK